MSETKRLWDCDHPYYCAEGNYALAGMHQVYSSWPDFLSELGDADLDMNLVFRFDWQEPNPDDCLGGNDAGKECPSPCDGTCGRTMAPRLMLFYMGQRKAKCWSCEIDVAREQEPEIREWLRIRWEHVQRLWAPFSTAGEEQP